MINEQLLKEIEKELNTSSQNISIPDNFMEQLRILFSDKDVQATCLKIINKEFNLNLEQLKEMSQSFNTVSTRLNKISEDLDIYLFLKEGYRLDHEGLMKEFEIRNLKSEYPDIDIKVLTDLYANPMTKIYPYYSEKDHIYVNPVVFRKFIIAILQMVFNEMDLLIAYTGGEGNGKSCLATQHMLLVHKLLDMAHIRNYKYSIRQMMFSSLSSLRVGEDDHYKDKFRQFTLDEGNELHRQNWKEEEVQTFFQRLRRERYQQRIKSICIPVLGELLTNIIMTRVNFIFEVYAVSKNKLGILEKGGCNFYIIPRGNRIYSYHHKKDLTVSHIKQVLHETLDRKNYLKGMPKELIVQNFTFNGVMGFDKNEYIKVCKESTRSFNIREGIKLGDTMLYILYRLYKAGKLMPKNLKLGSKEPEYASYHKLLQNIRNYFSDNPRILKLEEEKFEMRH